MGPEPTSAESQTSTSTKPRERAKATTEAGPVQAHHLHGRRMNEKKTFHKNNFQRAQASHVWICFHALFYYEGQLHMAWLLMILELSCMCCINKAWWQDCLHPLCQTPRQKCLFEPGRTRWQDVYFDLSPFPSYLVPKHPSFKLAVACFVNKTKPSQKKATFYITIFMFIHVAISYSYPRIPLPSPTSSIITILPGSEHAERHLPNVCQVLLLGMAARHRISSISLHVWDASSLWVNRIAEGTFYLCKVLENLVVAAPPPKGISSSLLS